MSESIEVIDDANTPVSNLTASAILAPMSSPVLFQRQIGTRLTQSSAAIPRAFYIGMKSGGP